MRSCWLLCLLVAHSLVAQNFFVEHQGIRRSCIVHLPKSYSPPHKYPLIMSFHGWGGSPDQQQEYTHMNSIADREGFIIVYPQSYKQFWNTGLFSRSYWYGTDDVGFVCQLMDSLSEKFSIDTNRIYALGLSLGGFLVHRLACELNGQIAAFASVSGLMSLKTRTVCPKAGHAPFLQIHGTWDPAVWYIGTPEFLGAKGSVKFWRHFNGCEKADTVLLPDECPQDRTRSELIKWHCDEQSQVWFVKIKHGGHAWPSGTIPYWYFGRTSHDFNGGQLVWDFFKQFSLHKQLPSAAHSP